MSLYQKAEEDWKHLVENGFICKRSRSRLSVTEKTINEVVSFILQPTNRQILASGSKKVKLRDGKIVDLPCIRRTKSRVQI